MAVDYYPYVDPEELWAVLDAQWDTGISPKPKPVDAMPGKRLGSVAWIHLDIGTPNEAPASTGSTYLGQIVTPFSCEVWAGGRDDANKIFYQIRYICNRYTKSNPPMRAFWQILSFPPRFREKNYRFTVIGQEVMLNT